MPSSDETGGISPGIIPDAGQHAGTAGSANADDRPAYLNFDAEGGVLFGRLIKYGLLTILTLSIYRFWAKTHVRRYLWNALQLAGDRFVYHGTPKELFIGFLIAIVILAPMLAVLGFSEYAFLYYGAGAGLLFQAVYILLLFLFWQIAVYRMTRYRLSRTSWRGIRFRLDGSAWVYLRKAIIWNLLVVGTLGIAIPWMRHALNKYRLENIRFGDLTARYDGKPGELAYVAIGPALLLYVPVLAAVALSGGEVLSVLETFGEPAADGQTVLLKAQGVLAGWVSLIYLTGSLAFVWYRVREYRYAVSRLSLGPVTLSGELSTTRVVLRGVLAGLAALLTVAVAGSAIGGTVGFIVGSAGLLSAFHWVIIFSVLFSLVLGGAVWTVLFTLPLIRAICDGLTLTNVAALEDATQTMSKDAALSGEGMADALDVGAI